MTWIVEKSQNLPKAIVEYLSKLNISGRLSACNNTSCKNIDSLLHRKDNIIAYYSNNTKQYHSLITSDFHICKLFSESKFSCEISFACQQKAQYILLTKKKFSCQNQTIRVKRYQ